MQTAIDMLYVAHQWVSGESGARLGFAVPFVVFLSLPFVLPLLLALVAREWLSIAGIAGLAWLGAAALVSSALSVTGALQFGTAWIIALALAVIPAHQRRRRDRIARDLDESQAALSAANTSIDRERLWRRAGGDSRPVIADDDIAVLIERLETRPDRVAMGGGDSRALVNESKRSSSAS